MIDDAADDIGRRRLGGDLARIVGAAENRLRFRDSVVRARNPEFSLGFVERTLVRKNFQKSEQCLEMVDPALVHLVES